MTIDATNGTFSGTFRALGPTGTNRFYGVALQDLNIGVGFFLEPSASGHVLLQPTGF